MEHDLLFDLFGAIKEKGAPSFRVLCERVGIGNADTWCFRILWGFVEIHKLEHMIRTRFVFCKGESKYWRVRETEMFVGNKNT
jgi:hypothetical protein